MPTFTINGNQLTVPEGTLILEAARKAGFTIPTFCYQADLIGIGSCRMCLVEVEGQKKLIASCVTPVMEGMNVLTESPSVQGARADMLEFLLANHGLDCPVCDKGGECELQDMVYTYGPHKGRYAEQKYRWHDKDYIISPVIIKNSNRCVQCMKCVRVCKEVVGRDVLDGIGRGEIQEETTFFRGMLDCDQDGNCIEVCPVGCFMRLPFRYKTRPWDLNTADTICPYCGTGCRMVIEERDGKVIRSRAQLGVGINSETLCARGRFGYDIIHHPERLTEPMIKRNGQLQTVSWEEVLAEIESRLRAIDPGQIGGIATARLTNEELYVFQDLFRGVLGSPNLDSSTRWDPDAVRGYVAATEMAGGGISLFDAMRSDCVLVIGTHLSDENPVTDYMVRRMARENDARVLIASARAMKLDSSARVSARHLPGREKEILAALAQAVTRSRQSADRDRPVATDIPGLDALLDAAGLDAEIFRQMAAQLLPAATVAILAGTEFLRFPTGSGALAALRDAMRSAGKEIRIVPILDRPNQRGAWEMGVHPGFAPGYRNANPAGSGCSGMLQAARNGDLRALYIVGEDPLAGRPDPDATREAMSKIDFLLVQDAFLTETVKMADCVLPGACVGEKEGTFTNQEGRVQRLTRLMRPAGKAKRDLRIFLSLGRRLNPAFADRIDHAKDVFALIRKSATMYADVSLAFDNRHNTRNELDNRHSLVAASGETVTLPAVDTAPLPGADKRRPFILITGNHLFHSGRLTQRSAILAQLMEGPVAEISEQDAAELGVADGDRIRVSGSRSEAVVTVRTRRGSKRGVVFIDENFDSISVNRFFDKGRFAARVAITRA